MVIGTLDPSLSRGIPYQSMRWLSNVLALCLLLDSVTGACRGPDVEELVAGLRVGQANRVY